MIKNLLHILVVVLLISVLTVSSLLYSIKVYADSYDKQITVTITDTTHTSRSNISAILNGLSSGINLSYLQTAGFILTTGLDTGLQDNGGTDIAYNLAESKIPILIPSLGADQTTTYQFLMGYSPAKTEFSPIMVNGNDGYITTVDNAALEIGSDFISEISGYVDTSTGSDKLMVDKDGAFSTDAGSTTAGSITSNIYWNGINKTKDAENNMTWGGNTRIGQRIDSFPAITINKVSFYLKKSGSPTGDATVRMRKVSDDSVIETLGTINTATITDTFAWYSVTGSWANPSVQDIRIDIEWNGTGNPADVVITGVSTTDKIPTNFCRYFGGWIDAAATMDCDIKIYAPVVSVSAVVANGDHIVKTYIDGGNLKLDIDGVNEDSEALGGYSVPDNSSDWILNQNGAMRYIDYYKHTVSGVEKIEYQTPTSIISDTTTNYTTGTATFTNGSDIVTGAGGAAWTDAMIGGQIKDDNDDIYYTIVDVTSSTTLVINADYEYTGGGGHTYMIQYSDSATLSNSDNPGTYDALIIWGINVGLKITFSVVIASPSVSTLSPVSITAAGATLQGILNGLGTYSFGLCYFQYGQNTDYGFTTGSTQVSAIGGFFAVIDGLTYGTVYHVQAIGQFGGYTVYGDDITFTTMPFSGSSTSIAIRDIGAFTGYHESGDILFCVETINNYTDYYPKVPSSDFFMIQVIDTDHTTILGQTPLSNWGDRPTGIYFSAASVDAHSIVVGSLYYIKMIGSYIATLPEVESQMVAYNWKGSDLERLDLWIRSVAINMGQADDTSYLTSITDYGLVLNDAGGAYVSDGIPGITQVRPNLFTSSASKPKFTQGTPNPAFDNYVIWSNEVGPEVAADAGVFGNLFSVTGQVMVGWIFIAVMLFIVFIGVSNGGKALGIILLNIPLLMAANYLRCISIQYTAIMAFIMAYLFIRQFYWKTT